MGKIEIMINETVLNFRKTPTAYQKAVIMDFKKNFDKGLEEFEDISFLYDMNGTTIYVECADGLVGIDNNQMKELGIENSIN
jgi:hypothetical protein